MKHLLGMRLERHDNRGTAYGVGGIDHPADNLLVGQVNAVEVADGHDATLQLRRDIVQRSENLHGKPLIH